MQTQPFGQLPNGTAVQKITIHGKGGLTASVLTYGAILHQLIFEGTDVVLGHETIADYLPAIGYIGTTVGRYANRIAEGKFTLNGVEYDVGCNETGRGHLHGGDEGFDKRVWSVGELSENSVELTLLSPDGDMGYPGELTLSVRYTVEDDNTLALTYRAVCDKDTVFNPTNHTYFNLNGFDGGTILDTELYINADTITPVDDLLIPTGERMPVDGTPFDFRVAKPIGRDIGGDHPQIAVGGGYDHNFCLGDTVQYRHAVSAFAPRTSIRMDCYTTEPGVQLYTANFLESPTGKGGPMGQYQGFCLETQHFPDSPNQPTFPSVVLKAGETFESLTRYRFTKE